MSAIFARWNEILRRAVDGKILCGLGGERFDAPRRISARVFHDKIDMRLFVDIVEKWKCRGKNKNADRGQRAEAGDDPPHLAI